MIWIVGLIILAFVLLFLEIFVPGGLLGFLAVICIVGAGYVGFREYGPSVGLMIGLGAALVAFLMFILEIRLLRASGRFVSSQGSIAAQSVERPQSDDLVGKQGVALTRLAPGGKVRVEGKTYEASSISGLLERGAEIEVIRVEDFRIIVKES